MIVSDTVSVPIQIDVVCTYRDGWYTIVFFFRVRVTIYQDDILFCWFDRMHAQALTLAVLSGAAVYHYYEKRGDHLEPAGDHN